MGDTNDNIDPKKVDLQLEIKKRKEWLFECQLRKLNMKSFTDVLDTDTSPFRDLVTEPFMPAGFPAGQFGTRPDGSVRVYVDNQKPVWTKEEKTVRDGCSDMIGRLIDWLDFRKPKRMIEKVAELKKNFERSTWSTNWDVSADLRTFKRRDLDNDEDLPHAMSRAEIIRKKPWLIPELYNTPYKELSFLTFWLDNANIFISNYENELLQIVKSDESGDGKKPGDPPFQPDEYRKRITELVEKSLIQNTSDTIKAGFSRQDKDKFVYDISLSTPLYPFNKLADYTFSPPAKYWAKVRKLHEIYMNKEDSDMGLCMLMRSLYLYSILPPSFETGKKLEWRNREFSTELLETFFKEQWSSHEIKGGGTSLSERLQTVQSKLKILLDINAAYPRSAALPYSMINAEISKQAVLRYKFWLDEPFKPLHNHGTEDEDDPKGINKARIDTKIGKPFEEMEYWSENHYIMFASSEYLAGQLWPDENFEPAKDFLVAGEPTKIFTGKERMERGKARVLKWLNNKLLFGWTEFNSSGYYREHMIAMLNLVDFALDDEVKRKATIAMDLILFDIVRFQHKGSMGACGGRSQFKSKNSGWDNAAGDMVEIMLGTRGLFTDGASDIGTSFATSTYKVPDVLLEIGISPPDHSFVDLTRVSIGFDEAPKYGIQYSQKSDQKRSLEKAYAGKVARYFKEVGDANAAIKKVHIDYGAMEDDTIFWWTASGYFQKEVIINTIKCVDRFGLTKNKPFSAIIGILGFGSIVKGLTPFGYHDLVASGMDGTYIEDRFDELSVFLEGSTRTRVNILTYRNRDVMLSSVQNFRAGQLNFQSNISQATLSTEINVFTTAGFAGIDISNVPFALIGAAIGAALSAFAGPAAFLVAPAAGAAGATAGVMVNEKLVQGANPGEQGDGPGWWTGYWALPLVVQYENAAILAYDFHWSQRRLADVGSHAWFAKRAFDDFDEVRTSAYDDDNFFLEDGFDMFSKKGYWLFGKKVHKKDPKNPDADEEGYIGVFSNESPDWLNKDDDFYETQMDEKKDTAKEAKESAVEEQENRIEAIDDKIEELEEKVDDILDDLEDKDTVGYVGRQLIEITVKREVNSTNKFGADKAAWIAEAIKNLSAAPGAVIRNNMDKVSELVTAYADLFSEQAWRKTEAPDAAKKIAEAKINYKKLRAELDKDYFEGKDWYADGKNIWIMQVGNKKEYGSYENFIERVSSAKIKLDDAGDLECIYHVPMPDGSSHKLKLDYDDKEFRVDGEDYNIDFYPRFENPFVRGGRVEWGQREYVIEYNKKKLLHQFSNLKDTERTEEVLFKKEDLEIMKGLVIFMKTGDEDMDINSLAQATVTLGCETVTTDQTIAAGEVEENSLHDVEWIFFDKPGKLSPDMTIVFKHPPIPDGDDEPEWKMSFTLQALLGDHRLYDCSSHISSWHFEDEHRESMAIPFSVQLNQWQTWQLVVEKLRVTFWQVARQQPSEIYYYNYADFFAIDSSRQLMYRRFTPCDAPGQTWEQLAQKGKLLLFDRFCSISTYSTHPSNLFLFAANGGQLYACWKFQGETFREKEWMKVQVENYPSVIFGIPDYAATPETISLSPFSQVFIQNSYTQQTALEIYVSAADRNFYSIADWYPGKITITNWRKIDTGPDFILLMGSAFEVCGDFLFALDTNRRLWVAKLDHSDREISPDWKPVSLSSLDISNFTIAFKGEIFMILVTTTNEQVWAARFTEMESEIVWERVGGSINFNISSEAKPSWSIPDKDRLDIFITGLDGNIYTTYWNAQQQWEREHNWKVVDPNGHHFKNTVDKKVIALNRIVGVTEIYTISDDHDIWKTWWT
jgi:hypothetical protein